MALFLIKICVQEIFAYCWLFLIEKLMPEILTLSTALYDALVSYNRFSRAEVRQFGASGTKGLIYNRPFHSKIYDS